ncbi:phage tail protein [Blastomonas sp.]|uniref:GTA baseplate fiber-binding domain-containing protein n=1 Tax=Blastomonas sp. TaxID=1909299 RepID=UPI003593C96C
MATLVLSTVGTLVGGPIGGALGALVGRSIDQNVLFRPPSREGPRLKDLAIQSSQYGSELPQVYGRVRLAGTVIWSTDLQERRVRQGGGKGRPSTTSYNYSVSFAVALSSRPIIGIGRIWAEGNLLRGSDGVFTSETGFRVHHGLGNQSADPLLAAAEGLGQCPAYRGLVYVVFEDMQLEAFGNRLPSLTFEVMADHGDISLATLAEAAGVVVLAGDEAAVTGIALGGESRRDAIRLLATGFPIALTERDGHITGRLHDMALPGDDNLGRVETSNLLARATNDADGDMTLQQAARRDGALALRYYDPERDYQPGLRRAGTSTSGRGLQLDFPAVLSAVAAQRVAERLKRIAVQALQWVELRSSVIDLNAMPGGLVQVDGLPGVWRVTRWNWDAAGIDMTLSRFEILGPGLVLADDPGRSINTPDQPVGTTALALFDMPSPMDRPMAAPHVGLAVAGVSAGWRGAHVHLVEADGSLGDVLDYIRVPATLGVALDALPAGTALLRDDLNSMTVALLRDGPFVLANAGQEALARGANLAMVGDEAIQFSRVEPLGDAQFRLSGLWRGRGGTEDRMLGHVAGEPFVMVDEALGLLDPSRIAAGAALRVGALGKGDAIPVFADLPFSGRAAKPLAPVHGRWSMLPEGALRLDWVRRSRAGFAWRDGVDSPLAEDREAYRVTLLADGVVVHEQNADAPSAIINAAALAAAQAAATASLAARIEQLGSLGISAPLLVALPGP